VVTIVFVSLHLAGDPTLLLLPENATQADIEHLRHALGFDRPLLVQYGDYLAQLARLDLGISIIQQVPALDIIASRAPYTLYLSGAAFVVAIGIGFPAGVVLGVFRGSLAARLAMPLVLVGQSMPTFWSGILLILLFAVTLGWLPPSGAESASSIIMPAVALGALSMATFARITRTCILEELSKDYVRAAYAKGIGFGRVIGRHVLRNASIPIITIIALELANLLTGAVIVETVFAWPGIGQLAVQAINARDFQVVQAIVLLGALAYIALNFAADLLYSYADPRIKLQQTA
jgi:peptide/nickel transport system permease protein